MQTEIEIPHKFTPREYQIPFLQALQNKEYNRFVWVAHRRAGKDKTVLNAVISKMLDKVGTYYYFLPTYSQAKKVIWQGIDKGGMKFLDHFPQEIVEKQNESEMRITLRNGSIFQVVGADNIDSIVGTNPVGVVFSEYPLMKPYVWDYIRPILAENGGWSIFVYTPRGMNEGWKILQQAKENKGWWHQVLTVDDTKAIPEAVLLQEKKEMPADLFDQEYYVKFIDGASSVFKKIDENILTGSEDLNLKYGKRYQIGVDLAKYQDYTVITVIDLATFYIVKQLRFNKIDWNEQKEMIVREIKYWNKARTFIDSTGVGDPIVEDLKRLVPVEPFHFSETSRAQLLNNLQVLFEQNKIKIPNDPELIDELKSMQYELVGQKVKMKVPEGLHDDRIMSLGLACWGLAERMPYRELNEALREQREARRHKKPEGISLKMTSY